MKQEDTNVSQQQIQPMIEITHDVIVDILLHYSYVQRQIEVTREKIGECILRGILDKNYINRWQKPSRTYDDEPGHLQHFKW